MTISSGKPLRLWPGVVIVLLQWLLRFGVPAFIPEAMVIGIIAGFAGGLAIVLWWLFLSRAPWFERLGAVALMIVALFATPRILHESIAKGAMGVLFPMLAIPVVSLAFVAWAIATHRLPNGIRRVTMIATILAACGVMALVRTGGVTGSFDNDLHWRWSMTPEERLLAQSGNEPPALPPAQAAIPPAPEGGKTPEERIARPPAGQSGHEPAAITPAPTAAETEADWPGFRGPHRDSIIPGVKIGTDWAASPPVALWRRPVGPGWSSFAARGDFLYTQEQRGPDEVVSCYRLASGQPVWIHRDPARFWESNAGAGPRGTPALSNGRVYTFGATGIVNALDARDGAVVWSRNAASEAGIKVPAWGFASSPLVAGDVVIVAVAGRLAAYDLVSGRPRWLGPDGGESYSSPQLLTLDGIAQVMLLGGAGAVSVAPADGKVLWEHSWAGVGIVQPAQLEDGGVLISATSGAAGLGTRRLAVQHGGGGWKAEERWTSTGLKPYYNDSVVHKGHAYGFDGSILACIDLKDGSRKWKGGRYGNGQLILLPDQDLLLVLSEEGELALVGATPEQYTELARVPAIEGKTWNHPVLIGDILVVRNDQEMAAFRLPLALR